jgi:uncharacterized protein (TIGR02246 family)
MTRLILFLSIVVALPMGATGCAPPAADQSGATDDVEAIHEVRRELRRLTREGDAEGAMALFTEDAIYMRPGEEADQGKAVLTPYWAAPFDNYEVDIAFRADEVEVSGDLAYVRGILTYTGTPRSPEVSPVSAEQRYLWILRREADGRWRIARFIRHQAPA